jgi:raffinose/stachyose/melibiose transport system permease protein
VAVYFILVYSIIIISLKTTREIIFTPLAFPKKLFLGNFAKVWVELNFQRVYLNSIVISLAAVALRILFASMASFILAKKKNRFNEFLYVLFLSGLMIPIYTVLVPIVKLIKDLGLMNSRLGLVIFTVTPGSAAPLCSVTVPSTVPVVWARTDTATKSSEQIERTKRYRSSRRDSAGCMLGST